MAVLLSKIGGNQDIPNLIILASTNRLNSIDGAFLRRVSGIYFVGCMTYEGRLIKLK